MAIFTAGFVILCGVMVFQSGLFKQATPDSFILLQNASENESATATLSAAKKEDEQPKPDAQNQYWATGGDAEKIIIGAADPNTEDPQKGFRLQLGLSCYGASIEHAIFSCGAGKGFNDRNPKGARPLTLLSPVRTADGSRTLSMSNQSIILVEQGAQLALDRLSWKPLGLRKNDDGSQSYSFSAEINYAELEPILKIVKTYTIYPKSYLVDCNVVINDVSIKDQKVSFSLTGPVGIGHEDKRTNDRKAIAGFIDSKGQVNAVIKPVANIMKAKTDADNRFDKSGENFIWAAIGNKYFTAIVVPAADEGALYCKLISDKWAAYYNAGLKDGVADDTVGVGLKVGPEVIKSNESKVYKFQLYLGPKDRAVFDGDKRFRDLGFVNTIDMACCCFFCPIMALIRPLSFGLITLMDLMYKVLPNYGVVIIILVLIVRLLMHPLTRKGQVAMSKMGKLSPMVEEIKKKYSGDKVEMNKQMMALYKTHGASPVLGTLPMLLQMPIWVALYTAIDASISLRGAKFLPIWITDLSAPDSVFHFTPVNLVFFSVSAINLLPILMGVAFYVQQKLTPQQPTAGNAQLAQQQKIMMVMMPVMFPIMLYSAPSGLNLYIMASTFGGAIEQYVIKKHIEEREQTEGSGMVSATSKTGGKIKKKKAKPFFKKYM